MVLAEAFRERIRMSDIAGDISCSRLAAKFNSYEVILEPDENKPNWWAGGPSVARGNDGEFYLAVRMREGDSPRGQRGYEVRILKSADGRKFSEILSIKREQVQVVGFERPSLVVDPQTGKFRLYVCAPVDGYWWGIYKFDDVADLRELDLGSIRVVLPPTEAHEDVLPRRGYKDPFIFHAKGQWHMYVIGYDFVERTWHFTSEDGESWQSDARNPVLDNGGWHNFSTRPACVMPDGVGWLFVYEGSYSNWFDPGYNIATGLGYTLDLSHITDLSPAEPILKSTTPGSYHTWRYSHWLRVGGQIYIYAEAARPNRTNEVRLFVLDA